MKKNYSKPIALMETFTPNQFVASCTPEIHKEYQVDAEALVPGIHVKYDIDQDGWYRQNDDSGGVFTSNHISGTPTMYYIGRGWGVESQSGQVNWPTNLPLSEAEMAAEGIHYVYLFAKVDGDPNLHPHGLKVYGGKEVESIIVNMS